MKFASGDDAKAYIHQQVSHMTAASGGAFQAHPRPQWRYREIPAAENDVSQLEWKIYRAGDQEKAPMAYWTLSIGPDLSWFIFTHSNTDRGPASIENTLISASLLHLSSLTEEGDFSLARFIAYVVTKSPPTTTA